MRLNRLEMEYQATLNAGKGRQEGIPPSPAGADETKGAEEHEEEEEEEAMPSPSSVPRLEDAMNIVEQTPAQPIAPLSTGKALYPCVACPLFCTCFLPCPFPPSLSTIPFFFRVCLSFPHRFLFSVQSERVKSRMKAFKLPGAGVPPWASAMSDEDFLAVAKKVLGQSDKAKPPQ